MVNCCSVVEMRALSFIGSYMNYRYPETHSQGIIKAKPDPPLLWEGHPSHTHPVAFGAIASRLRYAQTLCNLLCGQQFLAVPL